MQTYLIERTLVSDLRTGDPDRVALHCRWAADAYRKVGAFWLGGVVTETRMLSLAAAETAADLDRYADLLGIAPSEIAIQQVLRQIGAGYAKAAE